jgi:hypothetical protein
VGPDVAWLNDSGDPDLIVAKTTGRVAGTLGPMLEKKTFIAKMAALEKVLEERAFNVYIFVS